MYGFYPEYRVSVTNLGSGMTIPVNLTSRESAWIATPPEAVRNDGVGNDKVMTGEGRATSYPYEYEGGDGNCNSIFGYFGGCINVDK